MAEEPERHPYSNGLSGRTMVPEDAEPASTASKRPEDDSDVTDLPQLASVKSSRQAATPQIAKLPSDLSTDSSVSREPSPTRPSLRAPNSTSTPRVPSLPRKGTENRSPARSTSAQSGPSTLPSAATVQKASQDTKPPVLSPPPNPEPSNATSSEDSNMPVWSTSRRQDQDPALPNISRQRSPVSSDDITPKVDRGAPRNVSRGLNGSGPALETVQETSSDQSTPSTDTTVNQQPAEESRLPKIDEDTTPKAPRQNVESGSESGGNRSSGPTDENRTTSSSGLNLKRAIIPKRSSTSLSGTRGKVPDGSVRNMTVETETVSTIPQVSLGVGTADRGNIGRSDQGTIRMKPSTETIRPKKEKRKTRKPAALPSGGASSKADIFEAKVASAVDEADVSDSDETFVYESNPPDPYPIRHRYHSRTPSATSMASQVDQFAGRTRPVLRDGNHSITGKRSMKFTNNTYNSSLDGEAGEEGIRHSRPDSGTRTPRRHHIGRYGRNNMYPTLFDGDSPVLQAQPPLKSQKHFIGGGLRPSRNAVHRVVPNYRTINSSKKMGDVYGFDYDAEGADDERTPLVGSPRIVRSRHGRRPNSASLRQMEYLQRRQRSSLARYCTSFLIGLLALLVIGGATAFVVFITKPLVDVQVIAIQNVLASEQEIMLDLNVQAINPNLFPVAVDDMDVNIFARSRFVGTDSLWRDHGSDMDGFPRMEDSRKRGWMSRLVRCLGSMSCMEESKSDSPVHVNDGVDRGTDPIETDPAGDPQTMLLGRVFRFDSPLAFEPAPWNHHSSRSKGQIRLPRPGNKTEEGGTERWERVLQHQFELIVRGVIKYQLPLSSRFHSASVSSSVKVVPQDDGDDNDGDEDGHDRPGHGPNNDTVVLYTTRTSSRRLPSRSPPPPESNTMLRRTRVFTA